MHAPQFVVATHDDAGRMCEYVASGRVRANGERTHAQRAGDSGLEAAGAGGSGLEAASRLEI